MQILMIALIDGEILPGQDDGCEVLDAARSMAASGDSVTVMMNLTNLPQWNQRQARLQVYDISHLGVIPARRAPRMPLTVLLQANLSALTELVKRWRGAAGYDLIHCFGWRAGLAGGLLSRILECPLVVSFRDDVADRSTWLPDSQDVYSRWVWWWLLSRCCAIVCPDVYQRDKIRDLFLIEDRRVTVLPPVAVQGQDRRFGQASTEDSAAVWTKGRPDPSTEASQKKERKILYHGPLEPTDGLRGLLEACARIRDRQPDALRILLTGPEVRTKQPALGGLIRRLGLADRIAFLKPQAVAGWWNAVMEGMDLLVLPDPVSLVGNLIYKALALNLPVLAAEGGLLAAWFRDHDVPMAIWPQNHGRWDVSLERALYDQAMRLEWSVRERRLSRTFRPMDQPLVELYQGIRAGWPMKFRKGGEYRDVRIAQHGGDGDIRR